MKKILLFLAFAFIGIAMSSCTENYSDGEKVGVLTEFAKSGLIWDSWDGRLNITQTGMNTSGEPFTFSFDNDRNDQGNLIELMKQAQVEGWKIKIKYHKVKGWNWFKNRGRSEYFVDSVDVLDRDFANPLKIMTDVPVPAPSMVIGRGDTIFVVIVNPQH